MAILAGGDNARMEILRGTIYKAFLPIHGASCVSRHILRASLYGVKHVDVIVDSMDPALRALAITAGEGSGSHTRDDVQVSILEHAGLPSEKILWWSKRLDLTPPLLFVLGDTIAPIDLYDLAGAAAFSGYDSAIGVAEVRLPFGILRIDDDAVTSFEEKPLTGFLVNTGYMALGRIALTLLGESMSLAQVLANLAERRLLGAVSGDGPMVVVDSMESLAAAHRILSAVDPG
jgi:NDP-sugar pyrophosphorylase family protein